VACERAGEGAEGIGIYLAQYANFDPYTHVELLKPVEVHVIHNAYSQAIRTQSFSLIATVLNEEGNAESFIHSIARQTWVPDELVIVDGGSTDHTSEIMESSAAAIGLNIKIIVAPGATIAAGRNIAIRHTANELVVITDAGCDLDSNLCRSLIGTIGEFPGADLVAGIYNAANRAGAAGHFIPEWENNDWDRFLPSSRNLLIRRSCFESSGGYPEFLTKTGEDTLFDLCYRRHSKLWVFNKAALVSWRGPHNLQAALGLAYSYGYGDGESGVGDARFYPYFQRYMLSNDEPAKGKDILSALAAGYLDGRQSRPKRELLGRNLNGVVIILSGVPMTDSGGGQRGAQLALEFARQGFKIVYANVYPSFEAPHKVWFDVDQTLIELYQLSTLNISKLLDAYAPLIERSIVLLEFPHPDFLPLIKEIRQRERRPRIIYDYIDNWNSSLGWIWYTRETEDLIIEHSDFLVASAHTLRAELSERTGRYVMLAPNAFNATLFDPKRIFCRPRDLPGGFRRIVSYVGALWGEWFDWDLLYSTATAIPDVAFVLVGNASEEMMSAAAKQAENIFFVGLKPQSEIPSYLSFSDACIIPFKADNITKYVNPLKVYEYLAMGKPVVATDMEELGSLPGILISRDFQGFIDNLEQAFQGEICVDAEYLLDQHSWKTRVEGLIEIMGR